MSAEEWEQIKQIFASALNLPPDERNRYVREACGSSPDLYATICELLENHRDASAFPPFGNTFDEPVFGEGVLVAERFRVVRFIARGGMGEVFEVYDERLRQRLALKTLRPELIGEEDALDRFQRELLIARGVAHDSLCRVFDYVEHRLRSSTEAECVVPCLTMELLEGESLADLLLRRRPLSAGDALPLIRQIAGGLAALHERGIVHRDLKPSNIMLARRRNGPVRAVVTDFGLAKAGQEFELFESRTEVRGGAPYFMAPELFRQGRPSIASDIYAFGLIIDEMVTNSRAFSVSSQHALYYAKLWEAPIPPRERSVDLHAHWNDVILRCLDSQPDRRFGHATEVVAALEDPSAFVGAASTAQPVRTEPGAAELPPTGLRSRKRAVWATVLGAGAVALLLVSGAAFAIRPPTTTVEVFEIENQTDHREYDYLCKGTTNELMRRLSRLEDVRVVPLYAPRSKPPERKPSRFSLDGALQAYNGQIRLSVLLTDNNDHTLTWSEDYDRQGIADPLSLQSDIAQGAVTALRERLVSGPAAGVPIAARLRRLLPAAFRSGVAAAPTTSNIAFDLYMRGRHLLEEASSQSSRTAIDYFQRAVKEDPNFALAHSALADACINTMDNSLMTDPELLKTAREHAERAVNSAPDLAEAHASLAAVRQSVWDWEGAEKSYKEALRIKPTFARAHLWYAGLIIQFGRIDEALAEAKTAMDLDPYDRATPRTYGIFLFLGRRYPEAAEMLSAVVAGKELPLARHNLGQVYAQLASMSSGNVAAEYYRKAFAEADTVAATERRDGGDAGPRRPSISDRMFALFYTQQGNMAAQPYVGRVIEDMNANRVSPVVVAWLSALRGDSETAVQLLERAEAMHDRRLLYIKVNPYLDSLHSNPRFQALIHRLRL